MNVELLNGPRFDHFWPSIEHELDTIPHVWQDYWTKEGIRTLTEMGRFQCWGAGTDDEIKIVCFTQMSEYPAGRVLQVFLAFGNGIDEIIPELDATLECFARANECMRITVTGRPGWESKLRKIGFRRDSVTLGRNITGRMN